MPIRRHLISLLTVVLAASAIIVAVRASFGPFRFVFSVSNPVNAEAYFGLAAILLLVLRVRADNAEPNAGNATWPLLILLAAGLAAWAWTFGFPFVADDYTHITNALHATPGYLASLFTVPADDRFFRPLSLTAYAAQARFFGTSRIAWHAFCFALHFANSGLVYWIARRRGHLSWTSFVAALFFLLHGSRPEAVTWIAAQFDLWAAFFSFLSLVAFLKQLETGGRAWQIGSLVLLFFALLSKESAYAVPVLFLLIVWIDGRRPFLRHLAPSFVLTGLVFLYRWWLLQGIGGYRMPGSGTPFFYSVSLFRSGKGFLLRLPAILAFPVNWTRLPEWWLAVCMIAAMLAFGVFASARLRRKEVWFALGFMLAAAVPVHQFLLIGQDLEKSRVLYLPSAGFALLLAAGLGRLQPRTAAAVACVVIAAQVAALEHNLMIWRRVARLEEHTCESVAQAAPQARVISDVPNVVDGVYFLHTGLRPCVEWAAGRPLPEVFPKLTPDLAGPGLVWNDEQRAFVTVYTTNTRSGSTGK
jgi:hypothetical protein